jgi:hypothetical protein
VTVCTTRVCAVIEPVNRALDAVRFCLTKKLSAEDAVKAVVENDAEEIEPEIVMPPVAEIDPVTWTLSKLIMPLRAINSFAIYLYALFPVQELGFSINILHKCC